MKKMNAFYNKFTFLFLISYFSFFISYSQWYQPEKVNTKAADIYAQAYEAANEQQYGKAIAKINEAISIDPKFVDAFLSRAGI